MKLILNIYDPSVVMQVKFYGGAIRVIEELLPFDCLNCNDFFPLIH